MDWSDFPDSSIILPPRDIFRKPAPYLFRNALAKVSAEEGTSQCPVYFQGEDPLEVGVAENLGIKGYIVGKDPAATFLPFDRIEHP